jgi:UDP-glucose 4-epimerase
MIFGDGLQTRDFVYVGDVVNALLAAAGHDGGVFNIGSGEETTVRSLHSLCAGLSGAPDRPVHAPERLGDVRRSILDVSLAARELGWSAQTSLADGLGATWRWAADRARA